MDKALTATIAVMFGLVLLVTVVGIAQAAQPTPQYACPICGDPFWSYDELYGHFTAEHPAEPIEILWE